MNIFAKIVSGLLIACLPLVATTAERAASLSFEGAWVRAMPPGMKMTAAYGTLRNATDSTIELTTFSSPAFGDVSLHRTELVDGESRMRAVPGLAVPAAGEFTLAPGDYHLMLMRPLGSIEPGDSVSLEAVSADGRRFTFMLPVMRK